MPGKESCEKLLAGVLRKKCIPTVASLVLCLSGAQNVFASETYSLLYPSGIGTPVAQQMHGQIGGPSIVCQTESSMSSDDSAPPFSNLLKGMINKNVCDQAIGTEVDALTKLALSRSAGWQQVLQARRKAKKLAPRLLKAIGGMVEDFAPETARASSRDGATLILQDKTEQPFDGDSALLAEQTALDRVHPLITQSILQIAMGLGGSKEQAGAIIERGVADLANVVGPERAAETLATLKQAFEAARDDEASPAIQEDFIQLREHLELLVAAASQDDPVFLQVTRELNKLAHPSRTKTIVAAALETGLNAVSFLSPGFGISAVADTARALVVAGAGGAEDSILLHELYLSKRLVSRSRALSQELQNNLMAVQLGLSRHNTFLVTCAGSLIRSIASPGRVNSEGTFNQTKDRDHKGKPKSLGK